MENAVDAMKIAFAAIVFVTGLAVLFYMASLCKETARILITETDDTLYYSWLDSDDTVVDISTGNRIVGFNDILPTIYRYAEENYGVTIIDSGKIVARFDLDTETIANNWLSTSSKTTFLNYINTNILGTVGASSLTETELENVFKTIYKQTTSGTVQRSYYCAWSRLFILYGPKN